MKYLTKLLFALLLSAGLTACSDYLKPSTPQQQPVTTIDSVDDLAGLINGAYSHLAEAELYGSNWVILNDVRTGNAFSNGYTGRYIDAAAFEVTPGASAGVWATAYEVIANCNLIINSGIEGGEQIKGQAYALRALAHMMVLKLYGQMYVEGSNLGVPYITKFAGKVDNFSPSRLSVEQTLAKIEADYKKALSLLTPSASPPVIKLSYYGVQALLSRFYLFTENYAAAASAAEEVINSGVYSLVPADQYVASWKTDGKPAIIFEVAMTVSDNRGALSIYSLVVGNYGDIEVTKQIYTIFGPDDVRNGLYGAEEGSLDKNTPRANYRIVKKYRSRLRNTPVIRYAEVILNYAEAQARLGNTATALKFLNKIPKHRDAEPYEKATIENILLERRKEFVMEGLYYWQRLRTGHGITRTSMRPLLESKEVSVPFGYFRLAFPIPKPELDANPNIKQNVGYRTE